VSWLSLEGHRFSVGSQDVVVGSGERADWRLRSFGLAPRHFVVSRSASGEMTLRAFGTDHVVTLNGQQLGGEACPIEHGDLIEAGSARFIYLEREDGTEPVHPEGVTTAAWLVDRRAGVAYPLTAASTGIGRDPSNEIPLRDATTSRFHAHVRREAGGIALHPSGSTGTRLNGIRLATPTLLSRDDEIEIGQTRLHLVVGTLPEDVAQWRRGPADDVAARRPTVQSVTPLSADASRFRWKPTKSQIALLLIVLTLLFVIFFPTHK
jgi:pSer/pThr/pTyr-binding forkhead associated (FHA) protein